MRPIQILTLALSAAVLAGWLAAAAPQQGRQPDIGDTYPFNKTKQADEKLFKAMQGAWRLVSYADDTLIDSGRRAEVGYAVISDEFVSIEIHLGWHRPGREPIGLLSTGIHRFRLRTASRVELISLIGTFVDNVGRGRAEPPGTQRIYNIEIVLNQLVLEDVERGRKLVFERIGGTPVDPYGRPMAEPGEDEEGAATPPRRRRRTTDDPPR